MIGQHFYHENIKNAVAVFGSLFNNIVIKRRDGKLLPVPIAYGPRQKWLEAQKGLKREEEMFERLLPRMSYEMVSMTYDVNRKITNKQKILRTPDSKDVPRQTTASPVPYNLDFTLYLETKTLNDGWQIVEQILPFFAPSYTVRVRHFPADLDNDTPVAENTYDMPFTLTSLAWADDWTGDVGDRRTVEWTLEFTTKIWLHGPVAQTSVILDSRPIVSTPLVGETIDGMNRSTEQFGTEVGFVNIDSEQQVYDDPTLFSPNVTNLLDSDGNLVKIVRDISPY